MKAFACKNSERENQLTELYELQEDVPGKKSFYCLLDANYQPDRFYQDVLLNAISAENHLRLQGLHIKSKSNVKRPEWSHGVPCISNNPCTPTL